MKMNKIIFRTVVFEVSSVVVNIVQKKVINKIK